MRILDRALSLVGLQRTHNIEHRQLEAAAGTKRWPDGNTITSMNATSLSSTLAARRALYSVTNNPHAARAQAVFVSSFIGDGIRPRSQHPSEPIRKRLNEGFRRFATSAEISGRRDLFGLQADAAAMMVTHGEAFVLHRYVRNAANELELRLAVIHPDQIPRSESRDLPNGNIVRQGIELDRFSRIVAYYVLDHRPDDMRAPVNFTPRRIPARQVLHIFRPLEAGQLRGISWFAPVLLILHELDQWSDATLVKQKLSSMYAGVLSDPDGAGSPLTDDHSHPADMPRLEAGSILSMPPGKQLDFTNPPDSADFPPVAKYYLRAIASGLGLTYDQLSGDLSDVNFSSIRAGTIEFRRMVSQVQHQIIIRNLCQPIWNWWVDFEILSGRLSSGQREQYQQVKWLPPKFHYVNPQQDVQADKIMLANKLKSRAEIVAERGFDIEELDAEIAADLARERRLGITETLGDANADTQQ
ncbi:MAG: phage portal protein [Pseudomonadota bacterium]